jgi:hypothetical protein
MKCGNSSPSHSGGCKPCHKFTEKETQMMLYAQYGSFVVVNYLAIKAIPKLYVGAFALGATNEFAAMHDFQLHFGKSEDRWGSKKFLSDCGGGCAALIGVISGINVSKTQGFLVGAAFYASHISHQATILVPVTAFVAGQKAVNTIHSAFFQEKPCHE